MFWNDFKGNIQSFSFLTEDNNNNRSIIQIMNKYCVVYLLENILQHITSSLDVKEIVLYGIGAIGSSTIAASQFSMVVLIAEYLQVNPVCYLLF